MEAIKHALSFLHDPEALKGLILWGGYPVLFAIVYAETGLMVGFFLPGDSLLVTAGILAALGHLNPAILCLLLSAAAILGDNTGYWIGRKGGPHVFTRPKSLLFNPKHVERARRFYGRYGAKTVVLCRFVPIVRTFGPVVAGVGRMRYGKYVLYSVAGGILWITSMTLTGYFLGSIPGVSRYLHFVILGVIAISFLPVIIEYLRERKRVMAARAEGESGGGPGSGEREAG
jgi:membrane-associated protein